MINEKILNYAVVGGCILGGGGGGPMSFGMEAGKEALSSGNIKITPINEMKDDDMILCVSAVGAPAAPDKQATPEDYVRCVELYKKYFCSDIKGIMTNENGGMATVNGWIQAAKTGLPLLDAACNGRAHPTGTMGSMNLHKLDNFISNQVAIGGKKELGKYLELSMSSSLSISASAVRNAAVLAGGLVAVARNAVTVKHIKENGAPGALTDAINLGEVFYAGLDKGSKYGVASSVDYLNGEIIAQGRVSEYSLETTGGFDVGYCTVAGHKITFWNEYMSIEKDGRRLASFPDLIMTFDVESGLPVTSADIREGQNIYLVSVDKKNLNLSVTMYDELLLNDIERVLNTDICKYL